MPRHASRDHPCLVGSRRSQSRPTTPIPRNRNSRRTSRRNRSPAHEKRPAPKKNRNEVRVSGLVVRVIQRGRNPPEISSRKPRQLTSVTGGVLIGGFHIRSVQRRNPDCAGARLVQEPYDPRPDQKLPRKISQALGRRAGLQRERSLLAGIIKPSSSPRLLIPQKGPVPPRGFSFEPFLSITRQMFAGEFQGPVSAQRPRANILRSVRRCGCFDEAALAQTTQANAVVGSIH